MQEPHIVATMAILSAANDFWNQDDYNLGRFHFERRLERALSDFRSAVEGPCDMSIGVNIMAEAFENARLVGKTFVYKWGSTMRLASFFRVVSETKETVVVEHLRAIERGDYGNEIAVPGEVIADDPCYKCRKGVSDGRPVILSKFGFAHLRRAAEATLWDGKPVTINTCD